MTIFYSFFLKSLMFFFFFFNFASVNVSSRMESTGKAGAIQVTEETCLILKNFNYTFEQRGLVAVKGKGQLMTYYLIGKNSQMNVQTIESSLNTQNETNSQEAKPNGIATTTSEIDPLLNGNEVNLETNEQK